MVVFLLLAYVAATVTSLFFGNICAKLLKKDGNKNLILFTLLVDAIIWLLSQIPFVGALILFLVYIFGIGLTLVNLVWKKDNKKEEANVSENN